MKKEKLLGFALGILVVALLAFWLMNRAPDTLLEREDTPSERIPQTHQVTITETGFVPKTFTIKQGDSVTWTNTRTGASWPASALHPSHDVYPGSGISKCGTDEERDIFDACEGLREGESYTFTFNEVGSWNYHDHLITSFSGRVVVEP